MMTDEERTEEVVKSALVLIAAEHLSLNKVNEAAAALIRVITDMGIEITRLRAENEELRARVARAFNAGGTSRLSRKRDKRNGAINVGQMMSDRVKCLHSTQRCYASYSDNAPYVHSECWKAYSTEHMVGAR